MRLSLALLAILLCMSEGFSQDFDAKIYTGSLDENGDNITIDIEGNSYLFSHLFESSDQNSAQGVLLRKVDKNGGVLKLLQFERNTGFDLFPKDVIINDEGNVICLYMRDKSGSPVFNQTTFLQIKELDVDLNEIDDKTIRLDSRASSSSEAHIAQLTNGDYAIMSPRISPPNPDFNANNAVVSRFDDNFSLMYSLDLTNLSRRARCFAQVEGDNIIIGGPGEGGATIEKVDILDSTIVWKATLPFEGVGFNRIYSAIPLRNSSGYGFIANYANITDSLSGVVYFETDTDGNVMKSILFNEFEWTSTHFPSLNQGKCGDLIVSYRITDTTSNAKTRFIQIEPEGDIVKDVVLDFVDDDNGEEFMQELISFIGDTLVGIGQSRTTGNPNGTLFVKLSTCGETSSLTNAGTQTIEEFISYPNPNPGNEIFISDRVLVPGERRIYQVVSQTGRVVRTGEVQSIQSINLNGLNPGFYCLSISGKYKRMISRFIIE